jgi:carboxylesterase
LWERPDCSPSSSWSSCSGTPPGVDDPPAQLPERAVTQVKPACEPFSTDGGPIGVWLQHGFSGCPASMRPLAEQFAARGMTVAAPLLPGHGTEWEDLEDVTMADWEGRAESTLSDLAERCRTVIAMGLSMGGAMVLHMAARHPDKLAGAAVINADVRRPNLALAPVMRLFTRTVKGVGNDIKKPGQNEEPYDRLPVKALVQLNRFYRTVAKELAEVKVPLLVFSSVEDHLVKPSNSRYIFERVGSAQKELISLTNSYHVATLDYDAEVILERVLEFARAMSGAPGPA